VILSGKDEAFRHSQFSEISNINFRTGIARIAKTSKGGKALWSSNSLLEGSVNDCHILSGFEQLCSQMSVAIAG
jgi:hypothetical protein